LVRTNFASPITKTHGQSPKICFAPQKKKKKNFKIKRLFKWFERVDEMFGLAYFRAYAKQLMQINMPI
jgi:hypothetical protein